MINTILEVLVAVVVLIVIIAVLALRYLRADDSDTFDDIPDEPRRNRRQPEAGPDQAPPTAAERRPRQPELAAEAFRRDRTARQADARGQSGHRDREARPHAPSPERTTGPHADRSRRETVGARPGRSGRSAGADSPASDWESLSDVDYWTELAADKPHEPPAAGHVPASRPRGGQPVTADARQPAAARPASRPDQGRLPVRQRNQAARSAGSPGRLVDPGQTEQIDMRAQQPPGRYPKEPATAALEALSRRGTGPQRPAAPPREPAGQRPSGGPRPAQAPRPQRPAAQTAPPSTPGGAPRVADDDPLTSPSFPAITNSDSRSYRTRRPAVGQPADGPEPGGRHGGQNGYDATGQQFNSYPSAPSRATSQPDGYPTQSGPLPPAPGPQQAAAPAPLHQSAPAQPGSPAANPYGSYVSVPQHTYTEPAYQQPAGPTTPAPGRDEAGYVGYPTGQYPTGQYPTGQYPTGQYPTGQQAAASNGWYGAPTTEAAALSSPGQAADGYLPPPALAGNGAQNGSHLNHLRAPNGGTGYVGIDYGSIRYDTPVYEDGEQALAGNGAAGQPAAQYDQHGHAGQDVAYRQDQPGYPRQGAGGH